MHEDAWTLAPLQHLDLGDSRIAYRCIGDGPPVLLLHGWPFDSATFAALVARLAPHHRCYLPDTPGLGVSEWTERSDFSLPGQATTLLRFAAALGIDHYAVLAHDTGATIARLMAARAPHTIRALGLLNTEMPGHRPPWIPLYRTIAGLPGAAAGFGLAMRLPAFVRSPLGFGGCFHDPARLDAAFVERVVAPLHRSPARLRGTLRYLRGIDWSVIDGLADVHRRLQCPVLLIWGAADRTFPVAVARQLPAQFRQCAGLIEVPDTCFLVHEERPDAVAEAAVRFLAA